MHGHSALHTETCRITCTSHLAAVAAKVCALVVGLLLAGSSGRANTYLFSVNVSSLMSALQTSQGTASYQESAYYAIFLQPDPSAMATFTMTSASSPNPTDPNAWDASVINDPTTPYLGYGTGLFQCTSDCTWAGFYKDSTYTNGTPNQPNVTIISGANNPGSNIFLGHSWFDTGTTPYAWGGENAQQQLLYSPAQVMNTVMPGTKTLTFWLDTPSNLSVGSSYLFDGYASALVSGSPTTMTGDTKDETGLPFVITAVAQTPEPGTWLSALAGVLMMLPLLYRRTRTARKIDTKTHAEATRCGD